MTEENDYPETNSATDAERHRREAQFYQRAGIVGVVVIALVVINGSGLSQGISNFFGGAPPTSMPIPGASLPTPNVPSGTIQKVQDTGQKAVDVSATAVDATGKVINAADQAVNRFLGTGSPQQNQTHQQTSAP